MTDLVLSLFPGIGLLDMAFEEEGFCIVRGPDLLWGGDVRNFHPPAKTFRGVIGGPPCQTHSSASEIVGTDAVDLVPEFVRCVREAEPEFVVMENVRGVAGHRDIPREWHPIKLRDWDCGGLTSRVRFFWLWPMWMMEPSPRPGQPSKSVMASTYRRGDSQYVTDKGFLPGNLALEEYGRLQGAPDVVTQLKAHGAGRRFAIHVLGNGVPLPMGRTVARAVREALMAEPAQQED
jgi:DNA (cytosine-5)-methyltransferase 1